MAASDYLYQYYDYFWFAKILWSQKQKMQALHNWITFAKFIEISGEEISHIGKCSEVSLGSVVES